jgi:hypothetical protein
MIFQPLKRRGEVIIAITAFSERVADDKAACCGFNGSKAVAVLDCIEGSDVLEGFPFT